MKQLLTSLTALLLVSGSCTPDEEPEATIRIDLARRGADIPASMYGIFFEEINHAGDGGLYAELIQNRGFEDSSVPEGYTVKGDRIFPPTDRANHLTGHVPIPTCRSAGTRTRFRPGGSNSSRDRGHRPN